MPGPDGSGLDDFLGGRIRGDNPPIAASSEGGLSSPPQLEQCTCIRPRARLIQSRGQRSSRWKKRRSPGPTSSCRLLDTPCLAIAYRVYVTEPGAFHPTRWTLVLAARGTDALASRALEDLCRAYWYPLFAYVRRRGVSAHEAEDVVQSFFARLIEKRDLAAVAPEKGRFRSFLLAAIRNHLSHQRAHDR